MLNFILLVLLVILLFCAVTGISAFIVDVFKYRQPLEKSIKHCSADEAESDVVQEGISEFSPEEEKKREEVKKIANSIFDSFGN